MNWLQQILENKRFEIAQRKQSISPGTMRMKGERAEPPVLFEQALRVAPVGLIAEVKRRSPSAGTIRDPFDPVEIVTAYESAGAHAVSVLMDEKYFGGGERDFRAVRKATKLPLLYKEFVIDEWQIWHARHMGASAVLLIVAALDDATLKKFLAVCREARLETLVEVHDEQEAKRAVDAGAKIIGVNNRNLKTFVTSLEVTEKVARRVPRSTFLVSESGLKTPDDIMRVRNAGAGAVLVGESLLRQADLAGAVRTLMSSVWAPV